MPRPCELPDPWRTLARRYGGVMELSDTLEVEYSTLRRWAKGITTPNEENQVMLASLFTALDLPLPTYRTLRPDDVRSHR